MSKIKAPDTSDEEFDRLFQMAKEWQSMEPPRPSVHEGSGDVTARALNQYEIDSLLGFNDEKAMRGPRFTWPFIIVGYDLRAFSLSFVITDWTIRLRFIVLFAELSINFGHSFREAWRDQAGWYPDRSWQFGTDWIKDVWNRTLGKDKQN